MFLKGNPASVTCHKCVAFWCSGVPTLGDPSQLAGRVLREGKGEGGFRFGCPFVCQTSATSVPPVREDTLSLRISEVVSLHCRRCSLNGGFIHSLQKSCLLVNAPRLLSYPPPLPAKDTLSPFVAEACLAVMPPLPAKAMLAVENVRVCKLLGGSTADSHVVRGMVVQRDTQVSPCAEVFRGIGWSVSFPQIVSSHVFLSQIQRLMYRR